MVRIGIIGIGFMGMIHYLAARSVRGARVSAICSRDRKKLAGDWRGIRGNFGPPGQKMDLSGIKKYATLDDLLADPAIDLVDVCNSTYLHPQTTHAALKAGKHVLVEKPIALSPRDANAMLNAAARENRLLMVAHVLPFMPEFALAAEMIRSGSSGQLLGAHFKRVISKPDWSADIGDASKTGGPAMDLHIHDTHFLRLVCGMPRQVFSSGVERGGSVDYLTTQYLYDTDGPIISCSSGAIAQKGRPFVHGFELYLESSTLLYESGTTPLTVLTCDGKARRPRLKGGPDPLRGFTAEIQAAVDGVRTGKEPEMLSGQLARDALVLCYKECQSARSGLPVPVT
jgi:predicted dehydrogenase